MGSNEEKPGLSRESLSEEDRRNIAFGMVCCMERIIKMRPAHHHNTLSDEESCERDMCNQYVVWADRLLGGGG